jgi:hypothetical protein
MGAPHPRHAVKIFESPQLPQIFSISVMIESPSKAPCDPVCILLNRQQYRAKVSFRRKPESRKRLDNPVSGTGQAYQACPRRDRGPGMTAFVIFNCLFNDVIRKTSENATVIKFDRAHHLV